MRTARTIARQSGHELVEIRVKTAGAETDTLQSLMDFWEGGGVSHRSVDHSRALHKKLLDDMQRPGQIVLNPADDVIYGFDIEVDLQAAQ